MKSLEVVTRGLKLHARVRSGRPTVLFLHGLAGHGGEWNPIIEHLDSTIGVIAPDQRAHGVSWDGTRMKIDRVAFVDDAVTLIEELADGPVVVVGQSMGGIVAMLLAHARPDLVEHLVLVEAGIGPITETDLAELSAWFDSWPERFVDETEASEFFGPQVRSTPAWVEGFLKTPDGLVRQFDPDAMLNTMRALGGTSRIAEWQQISVPTTLIRATDSVISDDEIAEMLAVRPHINLVEIENSGHDVHLDEPLRVAIVLARLMNGDA